MIIYLLNIRKITKEEIDFIKNNYPKRYSYALNFVHYDDFLRCIGVYLMLDKIFGSFSENDIYYGPHKKPYIRNKKEFNYSHSNDFIVLAIDDFPVGIDIEKIDSNHQNLINKIYNTNEISYINECEAMKNKRFYKLWVIKESIMKLTGDGLYLDPINIDTTPLFKNGYLQINDYVIYNMTHTINDYIISVSLTHKIDKIIIKDFNDENI